MLSSFTWHSHFNCQATMEFKKAKCVHSLIGKKFFYSSLEEWKHAWIRSKLLPINSYYYITSL